MLSEQVPAIDLDAYLRRIGLTREALSAHAAPSIDLLRLVVANHSESIPFENLAGCGVYTPVPAHANMAVGEVVSLDITKIFQKLVIDCRGGYCFEQNGLLSVVLRTLGFAVATHSARVVIANSDSAQAYYDLSATSHAVLLVDAVEHYAMHKYLCDVGFGGRGQPPCPMRLSSTDARVELLSGEAYELKSVALDHHWTATNFSGSVTLAKEPSAGDFFAVYYRTGKEKAMFPSYVFSTASPTVQPDYAMANWFMSTSRATLLTAQPLIVRRQRPTLRTLIGTQYSRYENGELAESRTVDAQDLVALLETEFGLFATANTDA
ncbi:N-hydroxyarylamine O-acetyltransferase [Achlya hypogyna]|uniref:N-hydroxyarylamine O-acetyltransferase n=1 Tax=Achlya hypogyna TaxID=1202772 RepID=A0A1V9Y6B0_ACHHY|nr:N-hydroxyarylamine O-acetyltransferase [Achlya hypogyna]